MMGENSKIEWTDHTFNPWIGCTKVSPGCQNCYAEREMDLHWGKVKWGPLGTRKRTSEAYWRQPIIWDHKSKHASRRARVFCASLADVFEDRPELEEWRAQLWHLIDRTPNLDWLILTKRPENVMDMTPWMEEIGLGLEKALPDNVWIGTSVEDQKTADERIPELLKIPARVRFLSCEPLLGPMHLGLFGTVPKDISPQYRLVRDMIHWVICGGESGPKARPMDPKWARWLRDECQSAKIPFFFKQWGEWGVYTIVDDPSFARGKRFDHPHGRSALPSNNGDHYRRLDQRHIAYRIGKAAAGRLLDGREWNEVPTPTPAAPQMGESAPATRVAGVGDAGLKPARPRGENE